MARWVSAARRPGCARIPSLRRRAPRRAAVSGRPGCRPGNSQWVRKSAYFTTGRGTDADVWPAVAGQGCQESGEGFGDVQVVPAEVQEHLRALGFDLIEGERGDAGELLAVEQ